MTHKIQLVLHFHFGLRLQNRFQAVCKLGGALGPSLGRNECQRIGKSFARVLLQRCFDDIAKLARSGCTRRPQPSREARECYSCKPLKYCTGRRALLFFATGSATAPIPGPKTTAISFIESLQASDGETVWADGTPHLYLSRWVEVGHNAPQWNISQWQNKQDRPTIEALEISLGNGTRI